METRTKHTYQTTIYSFTKNVLVACPKCEGKALVQTSDFNTFMERLGSRKIYRGIIVLE